MGPLTFGQKEEQIFLGKEFARHIDYSEETAKHIDGEIRRIVMENYGRAKKIVEENREIVERIALALLERETLEADQIKVLVEGGRLPETGKVAAPRDDKAGDRAPAKDHEPVVVGGAAGAPDPEKV
jgi:cell division protease FtsH